MFSPRIVDELALRGVDCRAVAADSVLRAQSDLEIFDSAVRDQRVLVTNNAAPAHLTPPRDRPQARSRIIR